ncbi:MAG: NADH-quinone oxidoreductase subunit L, partial [Chloroflexi bacterium]|nr:NADH-quinone oxidoreductase subunit L [Chloroflexota bacterium]
PALEWFLIGASVFVGLGGIFVAYWFYIARPEIPARLAQRFPRAYQLLWNKYYVDEIYNALLINPGQRLAMFLWQIVDVKIIDGVANGIGRAFAATSRVLRVVQTGYARAYALAMLAGTVVVIGWLITR